MRLIANLRCFVTTLRIAYRASLDSTMSIVFSFVNSLVVTLVLFGIFQVAFSHTGSIKGMTFPAAMWSLSMYSLWWGIGIRNIYSDISNTIKDGSIETRIVRPQHYLAYVLALRLGRQVNFFAIQVVMNVSLLLFLIGLPSVFVTPMWALSALALFLGGMTVAILMYICIGLTTFWLEDSTPVMWVVDKSTMILGGSFVPVALLPSAIRHFAEWSPFGAVMLFAQAFAPDFSDRFSRLFLSQTMWICILGLLCMYLWTNGRRKVAINGG